MNKKGLIIIISSVISYIGLLSLIFAFKISKNIGYTSAIVGTTSLITLILSVIILKHSVEWKGVVGVLLVVAGVYFISQTDNSKLFIVVFFYFYILMIKPCFFIIHFYL